MKLREKKTVLANVVLIVARNFNTIFLVSMLSPTWVPGHTCVCLFKTYLPFLPPSQNLTRIAIFWQFFPCARDH